MAPGHRPTLKDSGVSGTETSIDSSGPVLMPSIPGELIISVVSHTSSAPQLTGHYALHVQRRDQLSRGDFLVPLRPLGVTPIYNDAVAIIAVMSMGAV